MEKLRVFEAFAGYGSQSMALQKLGIDYEVIGISEIDKYAIQAYMAVHGETPNYGDISKIDWKEVPDFDFLTYSFPCTDISSAGLQKGLEEGSGTRSSLLWECKKAIEAKRPKYLLMENVKALTFKKFKPYLEKWLDYLKDLGYTNFAKVLNAKNYGVPQNRERIFVVSVLGEAEYSFPEGFELDKRLKDILEKEVDESFYLKEGIINTFVRRTIEAKAKGNGFAFIFRDGEDIAAVVKCRAGSQIEDNFIKEPVNPITCDMRGRNPENPSDRNPGIELEQRLELGGDIANCITTVQKDSLVAEPKLAIRQATKKGYIEIPQGGVFDASYPDSTTRRGRVQGDGFISPTLTAGGEPPCLFEGITEPNVLTPKRTEYGKAMRKDYEAGNIQESRHNMTQLEPRTDGVSNTITTVQKDNLLAEPKFVGYTRNSKGKVVKRHFMDISNTIHRSTGSGGNTDCFVSEPDELSNDDTKRLNDVCKETEKEIIGISIHPNSRKLEFKGIESITTISPALRATDYKCPHAVWESDSQIEYKGKKLNEGDGLYLHNSSEFDNGALEGISRTLKATKFDAGVVQNYRIRKLTPRECFRLMGVSESDIDKIQSAGISKTQQYKMAGNSIVVDVLYYIFRNLFNDNTN
jgi:DNA (cytosine-5)-methyltransferase 1